MTKAMKIFFSRIVNPIRCLLSNGVKYSSKAVILSSLVLALGGGMNLIIVDQAMAGEGTWWDTAQNGGLNQVGQAYTNSEPRDVREIVINAIKIILGFLGIIAVVLIVYAGFKWMLSRGNEEQVSEAKNILIAGVIGLVIILSAYLLANFVINYIYGATTGQTVLFN